MKTVNSTDKLLEFMNSWNAKHSLLDCTFNREIKEKRFEYEKGLNFF